MKICNRIISVIACIFCVISLTSCMNLTYREKKYYCDKDNYITVNGRIEYIRDDEENQKLYLAFAEMSERIDENDFKIVNANYTIVKDNGADDKLCLGKTVTFITAPKYFGDGYVMPIVGLTVDDEVLLEFEEGYENLLIDFGMK